MKVVGVIFNRMSDYNIMHTPKKTTTKKINIATIFVDFRPR